MMAQKMQSSLLNILSRTFDGISRNLSRETPDIISENIFDAKV